MKFNILTLFPEMVAGGLNTSILGKAMEKDLIEINAVNIRDYTQDKHGKVDDYTYGGGAGMLMQAQPVFDAYQAVACGRKLRTVYVTPQGVPLTQKLVMDFAKEEELVFLCGHYEGIDERVLMEIVTDYISIGDYVLTGGELPAMVMIDAISRLVPGVLGNEGSAKTESFHGDLLEYPQYSRPENWHGKEVPQVLLSGNHKQIGQWRREESEKRTRERRPDLYLKYEQKQKLYKKLSKDKRNHIQFMESLARGKGDILYAQGGNVLLYDADCRLCMMTVESLEEGLQLLQLVPEKIKLFLNSQKFMNEAVCERFSFVVLHECHQVCYTRKEALPVKYRDIRLLGPEHLDYIAEHYHTGRREYIKNRILAKVMYGAFVEEKLVGFVGIHDDGSVGLLYVDEAHRRKGIGESLEAFVINILCRQGYTPYGHIAAGNETSLKMQERMGLYLASEKVWWLGREDW